MSAVPQLRPYQVDQIAGVKRQLKSHRSTIVVAPTGSGKTVSMAELSRLTVSGGLFEQPGKVLILVGRDELVRQTVAKLEAVGLRPDVEKAAQKASTLAKVVVASVQSLRAARLKRWAPDHFGLVIVDESHHAIAASYRAIIDHFDYAKVVGYTATPDRADGKALGEVFASVAHEYGIRAAIASGYLVPITARRVVIDSVDLTGIKQRAGDFAQDQLSAIMNEVEAVRGQVVPLLELARERLTVAYGVDVAHAEALAAALNSLRPGCARAVSGQTDDDERQALLAAFGRGEFQFLCNCDLLVEGWDCLDSETEILTASGWKSRGQVRLGDLVQSLNIDSGRLEMVPVTRVVERPMRAGESMFSAKSQHVDIRTSQGHQFFVQDRHGKWEQLNGVELAARRREFALPIAAQPALLPVGIQLSDDELRLIAWFMTDGHLDVSRGLFITQAKEHHHEIRALLTRLGLDFKERVRPNRGSFANAKPVYEFRIPKGSHRGSLARSGWGKYAAFLDKCVASPLHAMSVAQFRLFWGELLKGDGNRGWLWCNKQEQVDAYTRMAIERGLATSYKKLTTKHGATVFRVSIRDAHWLKSNPRDKRATKLTLSEPKQDEIVWCVTNQNSTLVTRRNGKTAIIGNCPQVACVAVVRPTRSRGRFVQMAGRGLRPAPWTNKRDCLVLTFTDANTHGLIGPADCLAGRGEISDEVRAEIDRLIGSAQLEIGPVIAQAAEEVARRREALGLAAVVKWRDEHIDPFIGATKGSLLPEAAAARAKLPPSAEQLAVIEKLTANSSGRGGIADKLPLSFTRADAYELISRLQNRERAGLCSYRQAKMLAAAGVIDTSRLTAKRASELILLARTSMGIDWSVLGKRIANQPECLLDQGQVA